MKRSNIQIFLKMLQPKLIGAIQLKTHNYSYFLEFAVFRFYIIHIVSPDLIFVKKYFIQA